MGITKHSEVQKDEKTVSEFLIISVIFDLRKMLLLALQLSSDEMVSKKTCS